MTPDITKVFAKNSVVRYFNRIAQHYNAAGAVTQEIGDRLFSRLPLFNLSPTVLLDLGCGTGHFLPKLHSQYPKASIIGADIALNMLHHADKKSDDCEQSCLFGADAEQLPFADKSVDLIFANLLLPWIVPTQAILLECHRVLKKGGLLHFSTLGPDSLQELRKSWAAVENNEVDPHYFWDMHDLGDALLGAQFVEPVMDMEKLTLTYSTIPAIMKDLKCMGGQNLSSVRRKSLMGKQHFASLFAGYQQFRRADNRYPLTIEIVYGHAWR